MMHIGERIPRRVVFHARAAGIAGVSALRRAICALTGAVEVAARAGERGGSTERDTQKSTCAIPRGAGVQCATRGILESALCVARVHICGVPMRMRMAMMALVGQIADGGVARAKRAGHADHTSCAGREMVIMAAETLQRQGVIQLEAICGHRRAPAGIEHGWS